MRGKKISPGLTAWAFMFLVEGGGGVGFKSFLDTRLIILKIRGKKLTGCYIIDIDLFHLNLLYR